jgi:cell division protein FtsB
LVAVALLFIDRMFSRKTNHLTAIRQASVSIQKALLELLLIVLGQYNGAECRHGSRLVLDQWNLSGDILVNG